MSDELRLINAITEDLRLLNEHPIDSYTADTLSRISIRLAASKAGLGRYINEASKRSWNAEKNYKLAKARGVIQAKGEGHNSTDAKELAILYAEEEYAELVKARVIEDKMKTLSYNVHDVIDSIKSRVIHQQLERQEI